MNKKRIVITGIGPIASVGIGKEDFWNGLCQQNVNIEYVNYRINNEIWTSFYKHRVKKFDINNFEIDLNFLNDLNYWKGNHEDLDLNFLIAASKLALVDSKLQYNFEKNDIGLIVTHENPGLEQYFSYMLESSFDFFVNQREIPKKEYFNHMIKKMMKSSYELQTFMPIFHIAKIFGLHGYSLFINNACASGAFALEEAKQLIDSNKCPAVVIVSGDYPNVYKYLWFKEMGMYSKDGVMRPFCKNANGFIVGEGAAGLVVESLGHARERNAHIYAEYLGGGFVSEGWKVSLPNIREKFYKLAITRAMEITKTKPEDYDLLIPHGVATPLFDKYETSIIKEVFEEKVSNLNITALKPYFGHNLGGNVILELVALMMMFDNACVLPTLNVDKNNLLCDLKIVKKFARKQLSFALKSTCAFAGFSSALALKRVEKNDV